MFKLLVIVALISITALTNADDSNWVSGNIHVPLDSARIRTAVFVNSYTYAGPPAGQWTTIDATDIGVPSSAKAVFLGGILIITHGTNYATCSLTLTMRNAGSMLLSGNYQAQSVEAHVGGGQRSTMAQWVPLNRGKFEIYWSRSTAGQWPLDCAYGMNLTVQAYVD